MRNPVAHSSVHRVQGLAVRVTRVAALQLGNIAGANHAVELKAKLHGLLHEPRGGKPEAVEVCRSKTQRPTRHKRHR